MHGTSASAQARRTSGSPWSATLAWRPHERLAGSYRTAVNRLAWNRTRRTSRHPWTRQSWSGCAGRPGQLGDQVRTRRYDRSRRGLSRKIRFRWRPQWPAPTGSSHRSAGSQGCSRRRTGPRAWPRRQRKTGYHAGRGTRSRSTFNASARRLRAGRRHRLTRTRENLTWLRCRRSRSGWNRNTARSHRRRQRRSRR